MNVAELIDSPNLNLLNTFLSKHRPTLFNLAKFQHSVVPAGTTMFGIRVSSEEMFERDYIPLNKQNKMMKVLVTPHFATSIETVNSFLAKLAGGKKNSVGGQSLDSIKGLWVVEFVTGVDMHMMSNGYNPDRSPKEYFLAVEQAGPNINPPKPIISSSKWIPFKKNSK